MTDDAADRPADADAGREGEPGADGDDGDPPERAEGAADAGKGTDSPETEGMDGRGFDEGGVSDPREKFVSVLLPDGETEEHGRVYVEHTASTFAVSEDPDFPAAETTRYDKSEVVRVEVKQHHSTCFVTTAVAGEGRTLDELRTFRDDDLVRSAPGRALVALYERVSPPVAGSLARNPSARPTRAVRRLVRLCGRLARRHRAAAGPRRAALTLVLVALYVVGLTLGIAAHAYFALAGR